MYLSRRALAAGGAATVLLSGGTAALAATIASPVGSNGVIHGCYTTAGTNGSHALVLQNAGTACPHGDTAIKWNQQGPPGPGLSFTVAQSGGATAGIGSFETDILTCPPSYPLIISGGYEIQNSQASPTDYSVVFDMPVNANSWEVRIAVPSDAPANVTWDIRGVCAAQS